MSEDFTPFHRVLDLETGHKFTTAMTGDHLQILDEPALGGDGKPLPAEPAEKVGPVSGKSASKTKES